MLHQRLRHKVVYDGVPLFAVASLRYFHELHFTADSTVPVSGIGVVITDRVAQYVLRERSKPAAAAAPAATATAAATRRSGGAAKPAAGTRSTTPT